MAEPITSRGACLVKPRWLIALAGLALLAALAYSARSPVFAAIANVASVLGLMVSVWVLLDLKRIHTFYRLNARLPGYLKTLRSHATQLSNFLNDPAKNDLQIRKVLASLEGTLKSLEPKLSGDYKTSAAALTQSISKVGFDAVAEETARRVYLQLTQLNQRLKDHHEDIRWEL